MRYYLRHWTFDDWLDPLRGVTFTISLSVEVLSDSSSTESTCRASESLPVPVQLSDTIPLVCVPDVALMFEGTST